MRVNMRFRTIASGIVVLAALLLGGCGYNDIQRLDEQTNAAWSQVVSQYQRRADLIPNLVNTVKGFAAQEQQVLQQVTDARSRVGSIQVTPELANDPAALKRFTDAQAGLTSALSRLLAVVENYPTLKSDQQFNALMAELSGTENRIAVERKRYIDAVQQYNTTVRQFPVNLTAMVFGYKPKPNFTVENEAQIQNAPNVDFNQATPAQPAQPAPQPAPAG